jgi:hypothetical protein
MTMFAAAQTKTASWPITVGAEGIAAAQFARSGFDVLVQSGHDKPGYDLVVTKAGNLLKVCVKASDDGSWSLTHSYQRRADPSGKKTDCQRAIDLWLDCQGSRTVCCLVQFEGVSIDQLPRIYLASPSEIALRMRDSAHRLNHATLYERYEWISPETGQRVAESLPSEWLFSQARIQELLSQEASEGVFGHSLPVRSHGAGRVWSSEPRRTDLHVVLTA